MNGLEVSVCLPTWNSAKFLPEVLGCLSRQTFRNWELVAVDSHSTDGTWEMLQGVTSPERRTLLQRPRGLYQAWNACIEACSGEWIYFATSDDWLSDDCLEAFVACAREHPEAEMIASQGLVVDETGKSIHLGGGWQEAVLYGRDERRTGWARRRGELLYGILAGTPVTSVNQLLIRRGVFDRVGMFPVGLGSYGDYFWQMKAIAKSRVYRIGRAIAGWRRHVNQATPADAGELHRRRAGLCMLLAKDGCFEDDRELLFSAGLIAGYYGAEAADGVASLDTGIRMGKRLLGLGRMGRALMTPFLSRILVSWAGLSA